MRSLAEKKPGVVAGAGLHSRSQPASQPPGQLSASFCLTALERIQSNTVVQRSGPGVPWPGLKSQLLHLPLVRTPGKYL